MVITIRGEYHDCNPLVNAKPFCSRVKEQQRFRAALHEVLDPPAAEGFEGILE